MLTHWRCVKMTTHTKYSYVALEFDMVTGELKEVRVHKNDTDVRKRSTTEFEICENGEWMTMPYKEISSLMRDFNKLREKHGMPKFYERDLLYKLQSLEDLR